MKTIYHIFTNSQDEWLNDIKQARALFQEWVDEFGCARLYEEKWDNPEFGDEPTEEHCIKSFGEWPF